MKRKELDRRISQLLDRIDGELAEVRDGLIQVDERSARHQARLTELEGRYSSLVTVCAGLTQLATDNADHSRRV